MHVDHTDIGMVDNWVMSLATEGMNLPFGNRQLAVEARRQGFSCWAFQLRFRDSGIPDGLLKDSVSVSIYMDEGNKKSSSY